jgi:hypothetical protein
MALLHDMVATGHAPIGVCPKNLRFWYSPVRHQPECRTAMQDCYKTHTKINVSLLDKIIEF